MYKRQVEGWTIEDATAELDMPYSALQRFLSENKAGKSVGQSEYRLEADKGTGKVGWGRLYEGDYALTLYKRQKPTRKLWRNKYWALVWDNGYFELEHRRVWIEHNEKPIPHGWHVHHINGDGLDNRIENLECLPGRDHMELHSKA